MIDKMVPPFERWSSEERSQMETVQISDDSGEIVGSANIIWRKEPFRTAYVANLDVFRKRGQGYGSKLIELINQKIIDQGAVGLLINDADTEIVDEETGKRVSVELYDRYAKELISMKDFYERHDWKPIPNDSYMTYNNHENHSLLDLLKATRLLRDNGL